MTESLDGKTLIFKVSAANTGVITYGTKKVVTLKRNGKPLKGGDIVPGEVVTFNKDTGDIV